MKKRCLTADGYWSRKNKSEPHSTCQIVISPVQWHQNQHGVPLSDSILLHHSVLENQVSSKPYFSRTRFPNNFSSFVLRSSMMSCSWYGLTHSPCLVQACNNELVAVPWSIWQKEAWTQENQQNCKKSHTLEQNKTHQVSSCKTCSPLTEIVLLYNCIRSQGQRNKYHQPITDHNIKGRCKPVDLQIQNHEE